MYYVFLLFTVCRLYSAVVMATSTAVRVCSACPTRLPSLSFDAPMVCHNCRGQLCDLNSFCDECRDWSDSFRNIYVSHMRSLETKRRYKQKKMASLASSPAPSEQSVIDTDSEINANVIDHNIDVSDTAIDIVVPVAGPSEPRLPDEAQQLIEFHDIPSSQQLIDFQEFTSTIFTKLHDICEQLKGSSTPLSGNLVHDRRFSAASSSDKPRPNPTYVQVSEEVGHPSPSEGLRFVSQPFPGSGVARAVLVAKKGLPIFKIRRLGFRRSRSGFAPLDRRSRCFVIRDRIPSVPLWIPLLQFTKIWKKLPFDHLHRLVDVINLLTLLGYIAHLDRMLIANVTTPPKLQQLDRLVIWVAQANSSPPDLRLPPLLNLHPRQRMVHLKVRNVASPPASLLLIKRKSPRLRNRFITQETMKTKTIPPMPLA